MKPTKPILPRFGVGSSAEQNGYDLDFLIGWLEDQIEYESEKYEHDTGHRAARLEQAEDAVQLLREVSEWTPLLTKEYKRKLALKMAPPSSRKIH